MTSNERRLAGFIDKFTPAMAVLTREVRAWMKARLPSAIEMVYDNYNALVIGYGPSDRASEAIFSIGVYPRWINLYFLQGRELPDPHKRLKGTGNIVRSIKLTRTAELGDPVVAELIQTALAHARVPLDPAGRHRLVIKAIAENQRPRLPK